MLYPICNALVSPPDNIGIELKIWEFGIYFIEISFLGIIVPFLSNLHKVETIDRRNRLASCALNSFYK